MDGTIANAAQQLRSALRQGDVVARIGPRQFAAVMVGATGQLPKGVPDRVSQGFAGQGVTFGLSGVAGYRDAFRPIEDLIAEASTRSAEAFAAA